MVTDLHCYVEKKTAGVWQHDVRIVFWFDN